MSCLRQQPTSASLKTALAAARVLLNARDADGACNRAYYAMFDAAHAALFALGVEGMTTPIKTHNGLVAKFGQHLVLGGHLAASYGETFNIVQRFRQVADYSGESVATADAVLSVESAEAFVATIKAAFPKIQNA